MPSTSEVGSRPDKVAQYHVYRVARAKGDATHGGRFELNAEVRGYDSSTGEFAAVSDDLLAS